MDPRPRALAMVAAFVGLPAFHLWLLYRMINGASWALAGLLLVAIGLFTWRIGHYWRIYERASRPPGLRDPAQELRQIRTMVPVLAGLLALHAWLITLVVAAGDVAFTAILVLAAVVFSARLALYVRRYRQLRGP